MIEFFNTKDQIGVVKGVSMQTHLKASIPTSYPDAVVLCVREYLLLFFLSVGIIIMVMCITHIRVKLAFSWNFNRKQYLKIHFRRIKVAYTWYVTHYNDLCCYFKIYRVRSPCANTRDPSVRDVNNETELYILPTKSDKIVTSPPLLPGNPLKCSRIFRL